jgi:hypothetical protein
MSPRGLSRHLEDMLVEHGAAYIPAIQQQVRTHVWVMKMTNEIDCEPPSMELLSPH